MGLSQASATRRRVFKGEGSMIVQTQTFQWAKAMTSAFLGALGTRPAGALLTTPTVVLFSGTTEPGPLSAVADFTPAAYSGYADIAPTLSAVVNVNDNLLAVVGPCTFIVAADDPQLTDTVTGYIVTDGADAYYGGERFENAWEAAAPGDFLELLLALQLPMLVLP